MFESTVLISFVFTSMEIISPSYRYSLSVVRRMPGNVTPVPYGV